MSDQVSKDLLVYCKFVRNLSRTNNEETSGKRAEIYNRNSSSVITNCVMRGSLMMDPEINKGAERNKGSARGKEQTYQN